MTANFIDPSHHLREKGPSSPPDSKKKNRENIHLSTGEVFLSAVTLYEMPSLQIPRKMEGNSDIILIPEGDRLSKPLSHNLSPCGPTFIFSIKLGMDDSKIYKIRFIL